MSKADKMFEELNYQKLQNKNIGYARKNEKEEMSAIIFFMDKKQIGVHYNNADTVGITMQELQAINEKVKELRWI